MTLRELTYMAEGKADSLWTHTSALMAQIEAQTAESVPIDKYHPYHRNDEDEDGRDDAISRDEFKEIFVLNPRGARE